MSGDHLLSYGLCSLLVVMASSSPNSFLGSVWRNRIVGSVARRFGQLDRGHVLLGVGLLGLFILAFALLHADGLTMMANAIPDLMMWASTFEASTLLDALASMMLAAAAIKAASVSTHFKAIVRRATHLRRVRLNRRQRRHHKTKASKPDNDNEDRRLEQRAG